MSNYEATKYDFSAANITGIEGIPTATIIPWSDSSVPSGFLECNGAAVSRSTYADLFAVIGTTYGAGDGSSTFLVPDMQDNVCIGKSNNKALASTGGANTVAGAGTISATLANATLSTAQLASHTHSGPTTAESSTNYEGVRGLTSNNSGNTGSGTGHNHNAGSLTFSGAATSVLQPYITLIYIIKT